MTTGQKRLAGGKGASTALWALIQADARRLPLADESVQCVVTSTPYWGLRDYNLPPSIWGGSDDCKHEWAEHIQPAANGIIHEGGMSGETLSETSATRKPKVSAFCSKCDAWRGCFGLEPTPELFVRNMVLIFREVRRVLRSDGTCWLNLGDSYSGSGMTGGTKSKESGRREARMFHGYRRDTVPGLKSKDQCLIPHRVAMALQADGWWLRDTIIWHKPNPMPSSVTDRTTTAHEYLFLLTKSAKYFYDADAIREPITSTGGASFGAVKKKDDGFTSGNTRGIRRLESSEERNNPLGRNKRSVWTIATQSFHGAHFATYPIKLIEPCILAGTSEKGCCPKCGAGWKRVVERVTVEGKGSERKHLEVMGRAGATSAFRTGDWKSNVTTHWLPTCRCNAGDPVPCKVLDPFNGAATTGIAAVKNGRFYIGSDLNGDYLKMSQDRLVEFINRPAVKPKRKRQPIEAQPSFDFAGDGGRNG